MNSWSQCEVVVVTILRRPENFLLRGRRRRVEGPVDTPEATVVE